MAKSEKDQPRLEPPALSLQASSKGEPLALTQEEVETLAAGGKKAQDLYARLESGVAPTVSQEKAGPGRAIEAEQLAASEAVSKAAPTQEPPQPKKKKK